MSSRWEFMARMTLRRKLLLVTLVSLGLGASTGGVLLLRAQKAALLNEAIEHASVLAATIAEYVRAPLVFDDQEGGREILLRLNSNAAVRTALIHDSQGLVFAQYPGVWAGPGDAADIVSNPLSQSFPWPDPWPPSTTNSESDDTAEVFQKGQLLFAKHSIRHLGSPIGTLTLVLSTDSVQQQITVATWQIVLGSAVLLLICALVSLHLQSYITGPISALTDATRQVVSSGDLTQRVNYSGNDEVALLSAAFNQMLEQLQEREARLQALVAALPDMIVVVDERGICRDAMSTSSSLVRDTREIVENPVEDILDTGAATQVREAIAEALASARSVALEYDTHVNGELRSFEAVVTALPVNWAEGERAALLVGRDVSQRKLLESQYRQAQKMEAIGQLAGGIAHDFNNLLTGIIGLAEVLALRAPNDPLPREIVTAGMRAGDLVKQLLAFSRRRKSAAKDTSVNELVEQVHRMLKRTVDPRIELRLDLDTDRCVVNGDPAQLESAVLNLGINARDAMPDGGCLSLSTRIVDLDASAIKSLRLHLSPGRFVEIAVGDTGVGIPAAIRERIFEPFFTTKDAGKGTGLGLAAVHGTVHAHLGAVHVSSEMGSGTTFRIYLPASDSSAESVISAVASPGTGHIMIVDDEELVRQVARVQLQQLGYRVTTFASPIDAIQYFRSHSDSIDLVIVDMIMPVMNGARLVQALEELRPDVSVLYSSGHLQLKNEQPPDLGGRPLLAKPFSAAQLSAAVNSVLAGNAPN